MLSLDGLEHAHHRDPFAEAFRASEVRERFTAAVAGLAGGLVADLAPAGEGELRRQLAGPLAVAVMTEALGLLGADSPTLLGWYDAIVDSVNRISSGGEPSPEGATAFAGLAASVARTIEGGRGLLAETARSLSAGEVTSNSAVMLFGGIETAEGMTVNAFWHLLNHPEAAERARTDRDLLAAAVEESLRLEPAAGRVDRYTTRPADLGGVPIPAGDLVIVSLSAANRDPEVFPDPDGFRLDRPNLRQHLAFAQGPHACVGIHLARLEAVAALEAAFDRLPGLRIDPARSSPPRGLVFRKSPRLTAVWD
jgi:cytochrome P450